MCKPTGKSGLLPRQKDNKSSKQIKTSLPRQFKNQQLFYMWSFWDISLTKIHGEN